MPRHAFHIILRPGCGSEYARLHDPVPAPIIDQLRRAGVRDYSIFLDDVHVFGVFDYEDAGRLSTQLAEDVAPEWTAAVTALMADRPVDPDLNTIVGLPCVFRFEGRA